MTFNEAEKHESTIRVTGKLIPAGTKKDGTTYEAFVAWKVKQDKYRYDLRFTKATQENPEYVEMAKAVANGVATEFDVTVGSFWDNTGDKAFKQFFAKDIISVVAYKN